ncbi:MAG: hypothetical protein HGGPFJEG_00171 [Ignavibacteria bacterium]|nr:hypothetical protein [Ignavibacteria bacterium]
MLKLNFEIEINAPVEKVWKVLWNDDTYRKWTSAFTEGSHADSDWKEGSRIHFLDGNGNGMYSEIAKKIPAKFMSFRHLGIIKDGKEQPEDEETKGWAGATENYTLKEKGKSTVLSIELDTSENYSGYMKNVFPKAMEIIKSLSEG